MHPLPRDQHLWFHSLATPLALGQGTKGGGSAEKQIETLQAQLVQAQLKGDTSFFEKHYVDDSTIIHGIGKLLTKAEEIANLKSVALKYESYDVRDQRIRVYGDTAVVNLEASIKRTVLEKKDLSIPGREGLLVLVEFTPGAREAKHTHPGDLFAYLKEGTLTLYREGMPTVTLTPGEVFFVPAEKVHWGECAEKTPCKVLVTFVVEKGKPLSSSAK